MTLRKVLTTDVLDRAVAVLAGKCAVSRVEYTWKDGSKLVVYVCDGAADAIVHAAVEEACGKGFDPELGNN